MELTSEDSLRLNVLLASGVQAVRIDEQAMVVHGLTERGAAAIPLHPSGRKESYLRLTRELLSGHALGSPGGFPVYLRQWTRSGQAMGDHLDKLLLLGEPEAVVSVAYSPKITGELARRAWWAMPEADNARRMLERACVADAPIGRVLADFLIEHLPFESDPHVMMDSVRIVLHPGLLDEATRMRLWNMASRNNAYYVPFLQRVPDDLPGTHAARADSAGLGEMLAPLMARANPYALVLARVSSGSGQAFLRAGEDVLLRPTNRDVANAALNAVAAYFAVLRPEGSQIGEAEAIVAAAEAMMGSSAAACDVLGVAPGLRGELRAMLILSQMDAEIARAILARTTAEGTLMRKKLEPVITPLLRQLAVLRGEG